MKLLFASLITLLLLTGCSGEREELKEMKVIEVSKVEKCVRGCWIEYGVTLERNDIVVELDVENEEVFNLLKVDNIVTVLHDKYYSIVDVKFPTLEDKKVDKE